MSVAETCDPDGPVWWPATVLDLPSSSSRAELRSAAIAAVEHLRRNRRLGQLETKAAPLGESYAQARAAARNRRRTARSA